MASPQEAWKLNAAALGSVVEKAEGELYTWGRALGAQLNVNPEALGLARHRLALLAKIEARKVALAFHNWSLDPLISGWMDGVKQADASLAALKTSGLIPPQAIAKAATTSPLAPSSFFIPDLPKDFWSMMEDLPGHGTPLQAFLSAAQETGEQVGLQIIRSADDMYRSIAMQVFDATYQGADEFTRRKLTQAMLNRFAEEGIATITYANGAKVSLSAYSEMVGRTMTAHAAVQGELNRYQNYGYDLVRVSWHGRTCPLCQPWEGQILSQSGDPTPEGMTYPTVSEANSAGLFHPNCLHGLTAYIPGVSTPLTKRHDPAVGKMPEDLTDAKYAKAYKAGQKQRRLERRLRKAKASQKVAISPTDAAKAKAKVKELQAGIRAHIKQNPYLPRKYAREQLSKVTGKWLPPPKAPAPPPKLKIPPKAKSIAASKMPVEALKGEILELHTLKGWQGLSLGNSKRYYTLRKTLQGKGVKFNASKGTFLDTSKTVGVEAATPKPSVIPKPAVKVKPPPPKPKAPDPFSFTGSQGGINFDPNTMTFKKPMPYPEIKDHWTKVGGQKGSNTGGLYKDQNGHKWYVKTPATEAHVRNELLANRLYVELGADVPDLIVVRLNGQPSIASRWVDDVTKIAAGEMNTVPGAYEKFVVDAYLANWDVIGLEYDNLLLHSGKAFRLDAGGALRFRAQGAPKGHLFGNTVDEIESLRSPGLNAQSAKAFAKMTDAELLASYDDFLFHKYGEIEQIIRRYGPINLDENTALTKKMKARYLDLLDRRDKLLVKIQTAKAEADLAKQIAAKPKPITKAQVAGKKKPAASRMTQQAILDELSELEATKASLGPGPLKRYYTLKKTLKTKHNLVWKPEGIHQLPGKKISSAKIPESPDDIINLPYTPAGHEASVEGWSRVWDDLFDYGNKHPSVKTIAVDTKEQAFEHITATIKRKYPWFNTGAAHKTRLDKWDTSVFQQWKGSAQAGGPNAVKYLIRRSWGEKPTWAFLNRVYSGGELDKWVQDSLAKYIAQHWGAPTPEAGLAMLTDVIRARMGWTRFMLKKSRFTPKAKIVYRTHGYSNDWPSWVKHHDADKLYVPNGVSGYSDHVVSMGGGPINMTFAQEWDPRSIYALWKENAGAFNTYVSEREIIVSGDRMLKVTQGAEATISQGALKGAMLDAMEEAAKQNYTIRSKTFLVRLRTLSPTDFATVKRFVDRGWTFNFGGISIKPQNFSGL